MVSLGVGGVDRAAGGDRIELDVGFRDVPAVALRPASHKIRCRVRFDMLNSVGRVMHNSAAIADREDVEGDSDVMC